jgi:hypothetical protein
VPPTGRPQRPASAAPQADRGALPANHGCALFEPLPIDFGKVMRVEETYALRGSESLRVVWELGPPAQIVDWTLPRR